MGTLQEVLVPDIGDYKNVEVIEVYVKPGDTVAVGSDLVTVETDKAAMDVPSPYAGVIKELIVKLGDKVNQGALLMRLETTSDADESAPAPATPLAPSAASAPTVERTSAAPVVELTLPAAESVLTATPIESKLSTPEGSLPYASPTARKLARELAVPLADVCGTGPRGRITRDDIHSFIKKVMAEQATPRTQQTNVGGGLPGLLPWPKVDFEKFGAIERKDLSRIRKISGANLHRNWVMIPHVTNHEDADITELEAFRVQLNQEYAASGAKITLLALIMKACVAALQRFPEFNASLDGDQIVLKRYYHIGFAADTPNGLVVPVIKDADQKGILTLAKEMSELSAKAREGKLGPADISGGSFSISSLGGIGGTYFTPIINAPEVAILGVGKSRTQLTWNGKEAEPRLTLPLSLSWDHRVIDGAAAGRFNAYLAKTLADFRRILL